MKVLVDANVFISFLLNPEPDRIPSRIVSAAFTGVFALQISAELLDEIAHKVAAKPYLHARIPESRRVSLFTQLRAATTVADELAQPIPRVTRDPKDDYLIAHAIAEQVDVLVSGDRDLLALDGTFPFRILTPAAFAATLEADQTP